MGSAPASGAVFRALAENSGRIEISETSVSVAHARGWTRGASSNTRGGCAPHFGVRKRFSRRAAECFRPDADNRAKYTKSGNRSGLLMISLGFLLSAFPISAFLLGPYPKSVQRCPKIG